MTDRKFLDVLDRGLMRVLLLGGYVLAVGCVLYAAWLPLSLLGALDRTPREFSYEEKITAWVFVGIFLGLATVCFLFGRNEAPKIAAQDPAQRPALRTVVVAAAKCSVYVAASAALRGPLIGKYDNPWIDSVYSAAVIFAAILAWFGARRLEEQWPLARRSDELARAPQRHGADA